VKKKFLCPLRIDTKVKRYNRNMLIPAIWVAALVYASEMTLLSIGYTLTYLTAKVPNFAHGTYAGIGIYVSYTFSKIMGQSPYLGFPVAFILCGAFSVFIFAVVINVIRKLGGGQVVLTISTLAVQIILTSLLYIYAFWLREKYSTYTLAFILKDYDFTIAGFPGVFVASIGLSALTVVTLHWLLTRTKIGIAMRATSENPQLASVLGVNTYNVQLFSWFLTGGMAGLAGAMLPLWFQSTPASGGFIITTIMAGSLLGGFENVYGAVIGGFTVGLSEIMLTTWGQRFLGPWVGEWRKVIPMLFLVAVLLIEPGGLGAAWRKFKQTDFYKNTLKGGN